MVVSHRVTFAPIVKFDGDNDQHRPYLDWDYRTGESGMSSPDPAPKLDWDPCQIQIYALLTVPDQSDRHYNKIDG